MSNMPAVGKKIIGFQLPIETIRKLDVMRLPLDFSRNEMVSAILKKATDNVPLTKDDWEIIDNEVRRNLEKRNK